ncbi:hypothetical protein DDL61_09905 [Neisseria gonorrhoeae]
MAVWDFSFCIEKHQSALAGDEAQADNINNNNKLPKFAFIGNNNSLKPAFRRLNSNKCRLNRY